MPNLVCHQYYSESQVWTLVNYKGFSINHKNVWKDKNPANGLHFGVHLINTEKKTLKNLSSLKTNNTNSDKTKKNQVQKKIILDKSL